MTSTTQNEHDIETALGVSRAILSGDWKTLDALLAPDFVYHGDLGTPYSRDEYIGFMQSMKAAMSGMTMDFTHTVASDGLVSIRFVTKALHSKAFMGAPASHKNVEIRGIFIRRIENGLVAEEFQATDLLWMMTQMGAGTLFGYWLGVGVLKKSPAIPARIDV